MSARRAGPLARVNLFRLGVTLVIVVTAILAVALPAGAFRWVFRATLAVGVLLLLGSSLVQWWTRRARNSRRR